jgi:HEAT repeat protein
LGVVQGLLGQEDELAIRTLILLSQDADGRVRDWATFGLAQLDADTEAIREALAARLADPDASTRLEACEGLLKRRDVRLVAALAEALAACNH